MKQDSLNLILILSALVSVALSTECYVCTDSECQDDYSGQPEHEVDCARIDGHTEDGGCSKWKSKTKSMGSVYYYVERKCGRRYDNSECAHTDRLITVDGESNRKVQIWTCSCKGDKCNTAAGTMSLSLSVGIAVMTKWILL